MFSIPEHDWSGWLGSNLSRVRLNVIEPRLATGGPPLWRNAGDGSAGGSSRGQSLPAWLDSKVCVLPDRLWHKWECAVNTRLYGIDCGVDSRGWLLLPLWRDRRRRLRRRYPPPARRSAPGTRGRGRRLAWVASDPHATVRRPPRTIKPRRRHAPERHVRPASCRAHWFDFDTVHNHSEPALARHADDLSRSFTQLWRPSSTSPFPSSPRPSNRRTATWPYGSSPFSPCSKVAAYEPFHLAQASPPVGRRKEVEQLLCGSVGSRESSERQVFDGSIVRSVERGE